MWQQKNAFEQSNVLDVTIQCQFNVATKNVTELSTKYCLPSQQTTPNTYPAPCSGGQRVSENMVQCRVDNVTPTKPMYQCEFEAQQQRHGDSVLVGNSCRYENEVSMTGYRNSATFNNSGSGYYFSHMNDSGYGSPVMQMGHENNSVFSPCAETSRQSESGSPVLESGKNLQVHLDIFSECKGVNSIHSENSGKDLDYDSCGMKIAMRERDVMQRLFSLRSVNGKAANDIEQYYQSQTTAIDLERHSVLCQMAYNKESANSIHKYFNLKLLSLLECVEGKLSASENRKCKGIKSKTNTDRKSRLLPKHAVKLMQTWYDENLENPYPSREVTLSMASNGGVSVEQIRKWFANKRNRSRNSKLKASDIEAEDL